MIKQLIVTVEVFPGSSIYYTCEEVKELACFIGKELEFSFNGVKLTCYPDTPVKELTDLYFAKLHSADVDV